MAASTPRRSSGRRGNGFCWKIDSPRSCKTTCRSIRSGSLRCLCVLLFKESGTCRTFRAGDLADAFKLADGILGIVPVGSEKTAEQKQTKVTGRRRSNDSGSRSPIRPARCWHSRDLGKSRTIHRRAVPSSVVGVVWVSSDTEPLSGEREVSVMNTTPVVLKGRIQPDGTLEVTEKVDLPAGPAHVTVQPVAEPVQPDRFWKMMESIWADLRQRANAPH